MPSSANFSFLKDHDPRLVKLGGQAELYFRDDPSTTIGKLRQFAELLAKLIAANHAQYSGGRETFEGTLRRLCDLRIIPRETANLFHVLRKLGNDAVHEAKGSHADAMTSLKFARQLGIWFHRTYGRQPNFHPGPLVPPSMAADAAEALKGEVAALQRKIAELTDAAAAAEQQAEEQSRSRETAEERLRREAEERATWEQLALESEAARLELASRLAAHVAAGHATAATGGFGGFGKRANPAPVGSATDLWLAALQVAAAAAPKEQLIEFLQLGEQAAAKIDLDEADTRAFIAQQLQADMKAIRYPFNAEEGVRPAKPKSLWSFWSNRHS